MARTGRPSKLTAELSQTILADIAAGLHPEVAAQAAGIVPSTYFDWMQRGKAGEAPYATFRSDVARAKAEAERQLLQRALGGDGKGTSFGPAKAALEILSRTRPDRYSQQVKVQLRQDIERILDVVQRVCGTEDFLRVVEALADDDSEGEIGAAPGDSSEVRH